MSAYDNNVCGMHDFLPQGCISKQRSSLNLWIFGGTSDGNELYAQLPYCLLVCPSALSCPWMEFWTTSTTQCYRLLRKVLPVPANTGSTWALASCYAPLTLSPWQVDPTPHSCVAGLVLSARHHPNSMHLCLNKTWILLAGWNLVAYGWKVREPLF